MADNTRFNGLEDAFQIIMERSRQNLLTGCMEWTGTVNRKGYGSIRCDRKMKKVYRVVWEAVFGPVPDGLHVLHHCDNPACVETKHLFLGTNKENIKDKCDKDRSGKKLCIDDAKKIKEMLSSKMSVYSIARMFDVHPCSITRIRDGKRWAYV